MINISNSLDLTKIKDIEDRHWNWFKKEKLKNLILKINRDDDILQLFFDNKGLFNLWLDKNNKESYEEWINKQDESKFEVFKSFIIGNKEIILKMIDKIGKVDKESINAYFEGLYSKFRSSNGEWSGVELINRLNIKTCPYCNRNSIDTYKVTNSGKLKTNAQIDHFYPKEIYPYLAISLYNLIPSCSSCNLIKKNIDIEIIYPYEEEFGEHATFETEFIDGEYDINYFYGKSDAFNIKLNIKADKDSSLYSKIKNSNEVFHIEDIYNSRKYHVMDLLKKYSIYDKSFIDELYVDYIELFESKKDLVQMIFDTYIETDNLCEKPLSKLNRDLLLDIGFSFDEILD